MVYSGRVFQRGIRVKRTLKTVALLSTLLLVFFVFVIIAVIGVFGWKTVSYELENPYPDGFREVYLDQYTEYSSCSSLFKVMLIPEVNTVYESSGKYGIRFGAYSTVDNANQTALVDIQVFNDRGGIEYPISDLVGELESKKLDFGSQGVIQVAEWNGPYVMDLYSTGADQVDVILRVRSDCDYDDCGEQDLHYKFHRIVRRGLFKFST